MCLHTCKLESAICFRPVDRLFSFAGVSERRESNGLLSPDLVPSSKSLAFASRICDCFVISKSARVLTLDARSSGVSDCNVLLPLRATKKAKKIINSRCKSFHLRNF